MLLSAYKEGSLLRGEPDKHWEDRRAFISFIRRAAQIWTSKIMNTGNAEYFIMTQEEWWDIFDMVQF